MDKVRIHGAANAKAKAMIGKLLKKEDYKKLIRLDSTYEVLDYLYKNTHYSEVFKDSEYKVEDAEILIKKYFVKSLEKLYHFYYDEYRDFFKALLMRYEIENIKLFLRVLIREESGIIGQEHYIYSELFQSINYKIIKDAHNLNDFVEALKDSIYYKTLKKYIEEDKDKILFYMEMALDRIYFNNLYNKIIKLKDQDKKATLEMLGINIDLLNIQWIYRGRKYFKISSEELFNLSLENGYKYGLRKLKEFCYMDLEEFKALIKDSSYEKIFEDKVYLMERAYERYLFSMLDEYIKDSRLSIVTPIVYIFKIEYEMRDLSTILESIKYNIDNIEEFLIIRLNRGESIVN